MLAMNLRPAWGIRFPASSLTTIASMLAPTQPQNSGSPDDLPYPRENTT